MLIALSRCKHVVIRRVTKFPRYQVNCTAHVRMKEGKGERGEEKTGDGFVGQAADLKARICGGAWHDSRSDFVCTWIERTDTLDGTVSELQSTIESISDRKRRRRHTSSRR